MRYKCENMWALPSERSQSVKTTHCIFSTLCHSGTVKSVLTAKRLRITARAGRMSRQNTGDIPDHDSTWYNHVMVDTATVHLSKRTECTSPRLTLMATKGCGWHDGSVWHDGSSVVTKACRGERCNEGYAFVDRRPVRNPDPALSLLWA
jgi:hypothetical protein